MVVVIVVGGGSLRVGPQASGSCTVALIGGNERRTFGEDFDAASRPRSVFSAGDDAIIIFLVGGVYSREHLGGGAGLFFAEHIIFAIFIATIVEQNGVGRHAFLESHEIFAGLRRPSALCDGDEARQCRPFHQVGVGDVFCPERSLHTARHFCRDVACVGVFHVVGTVAGVGRVLLRVALFAVDVVRTVGGENRWQTERLGLLH